MKRRLFNLAALLSLSMCLGCLFMWVRSGYADDALSAEHRAGTSYKLASARGAIRLEVFTSSAGLPTYRLSDWAFLWEAIPATRQGALWPLPSYVATDANCLGGPGPTLINRQATMPYWLFLILTTMLPALWFWKQRREKRLARRGFEVAVEKPTDDSQP